MNFEYYSYLCTRKSNYSDSNDTKQAIQHIQGGTRSGVPAGVLHGARGAADVPAGRDAGEGGRTSTVGGLRGAGLLQVHGLPLGDEGDAWLVQERRGGQGLMHGVRLRGLFHVFLLNLAAKKKRSEQNANKMQATIAYFLYWFY